MRTLLSTAASLVVCSVLVGSAVDAGAQSFQGSLRGAVRDSQGVVPGATVTLKNDATTVSRDTASNAAGEYSFPAVEPGVYTVTATVPGFKTFERKALRVGTQQAITLDILMEVGAVSETITVTAAAPLIETSNASTGEVIDQEEIAILPQIARNVFTLATTVPTVQSSGAGWMVRMQDQTNASALSLGGGAVRANGYLLDGFSVTDLRNRASINPSAEAIGGLRVQVHTYDVETGRSGGGVLNSTARSGTNTYQGTIFGQFRPDALIGENFFLRVRGQESAPQYYRTYGGNLGGPVIRGKTFFWFATEGYRDAGTNNEDETVATSAMRTGDFSAVRGVNGQPITIYDPLTTDANGNRQPFAGNRIPANRLNPVGQKILAGMPLPDRDVADGNVNRSVGDVVTSKALQYSVKIDHSFSSRVGLSGIYLKQASTEPGPQWFPQTPYANGFGFSFNRDIHVGVLNNTYILNNATVATVRFGINRFTDNQTIPDAFDTHDLGWNTAFADSLARQKFPGVDMTGYKHLGPFGATLQKWYSYGFNGSVTRLAGAHSFKFGADYQVIGTKGQNYGESAGSYNFNGRFTAANANSQGLNTGNAIADLLLGYPAGGSLTLYSFIDNYVNYYAGYVQDDWRATNKLTVNYGLRIEHETGLREANDRLIVGFDRDAASPLNVTIPGSVDTLTGQAKQVKGGLLYGGVNGQPTQPGDPPAVQFSPRVGAAYSLNDKTVIRAGYGLFWSPWSYGLTSPAGYANTTTMQQTTNIPSVSIANPFPGGLIAPTGNARGMLTGVSSSVSFVDPTRTAPRVHQYSADVQRQLTDDMSVTIGYTGASGRHLGWGGSDNPNININQLDPKYQALGASLNDLVPNPFFGNPDAGSFAGLATVARGQLLLPYPQFTSVNMQQSTLAKSQYHAAVFSLRKRMSHGWAANASYTWSRLSDNQFGQSNFFTTAPGILNNYTAVPWSSYYNPDAEYGRSILDSPHKVSFTPIVQLPFGEGRRWLNKGGISDWLAGGWSVSSIITMQSGFPIGVSQSAPATNYGAAQRPNIVPGVDPRLPGSVTTRIEANPQDTRYLNPAAFSPAPAFTSGNAPRILPGVYSPWRNQTDIGINKEFRTHGTQRAMLQIQIINLFNNPWYWSFASTNISSASFGQMGPQGNLSRLAQVMFRYSF